MDKPDKHPYLAFTISTPDNVAIARFVERFGVQPEKVERWIRPPILVVGPVPEKTT